MSQAFVACKQEVAAKAWLAYLKWTNAFGDKQERKIKKFESRGF